MEKKLSAIIFLSCLVGLTAAFYFYVEGEKFIDGFEFWHPFIARHPFQGEFLNDYRIFESSLQGTWLEANLQTMQVSAHYQDGDTEILQIVRKGDIAEWGGTAAGLYRVIFKSKAWFSNTANVYMPNAINFYGKYYFHGEPYYSNGEKFYSENSGGCLSLTNRDSKVIYDLAERNMPVLVIDQLNDNFKYPASPKSSFPELSAESYLVADLDSGLIMAKKDETKEISMASLAKLMTATVIAENADISSFLLVRESMLNGYGSTVGLEAGKRFGIVELMYPLLIESSNDAAQVLASYFGVPRTLELMNQKAKSILMPNTVFSDVSGFDPGNISTAKDLFYLVRYIANNRLLIFKISKGEEVNWSRSGNAWVLNNKNVFFADPDFIGGKTGHISSTGYHGLFVFQLSDGQKLSRRIAIIILGSEKLDYGEKSMPSEARKILQWVKENYFQPANLNS